MGYGYYDYYDYGYDYGLAESAAGGIAGFLAVFLIVFYLLMLAFGIVAYILQAVGMYTIAKRRGIHHPWLAWIPVGDMWLLGSISDQYQYIAKGRVRNRRRVLLGLVIAILVLLIPMNICSFAAAAGQSSVTAGALLAVALLCLLVYLVLAIIVAVFEWIALYDLFASSDPNNAVMYIVLSIFFGVTLPFFIFACRKKDLGMPPRRPVQPAQPAFQPTWQPVQASQPEEIAQAERETPEEISEKPEADPEQGS